MLRLYQAGRHRDDHRDDPGGQKVELDGPKFLTERKIQGTMMGANRFRIDMPRYIEFYLQGRLNLDDMISKRGKLEDVNEAFRAMKRARSPAPY